MNLTKNEKEYLLSVLKKELTHFKKDKKTVLFESAGFLKAEEEYESFLNDLIKKIV
jgi:rRNA pseudouridine-1189 N-methylase Emg1 (Nep1/Mra1 family)